MLDSQKLLMLLDLLDGEPKKIADRIAGDEYSTRSYTDVWHVLEEHYGGLIKAKKDALNRLETFPKIKAFTKENALEFASLLANIIQKYTTHDRGLIDEGGVLSSLAKKVVPESEVVKYFQKISEYNRNDTLMEFYNYIEAKRKALNLTSAHFSSTTTSKSQSHIARDESPDDSTILASQSDSRPDNKSRSNLPKKVSFEEQRKTSEKRDFSGGGRETLCLLQGRSPSLELRRVQDFDHRQKILSCQKIEVLLSLSWTCSQCKRLHLASRRKVWTRKLHSISSQTSAQLGDFGTDLL